MYNLFVTGREEAWDLPAYEYGKDRFLEHSNDKESTQFKLLTAENIEILKSFPCLFAYEGTNSSVRVGYLRTIKERGLSILIEYDFDAEIPKIEYSQLEPISSDLDIRKWEMNRTHWAVKDEELNFKVAFSFPGELRATVGEIVDRIKEELPVGSIFYDDDFTAQLAQPNLDSLLQTVYLKNSDLVVVFLSSDYEKKKWCGIEWRAIRGIINNKSDHAVMFIRSDDTEMPGVYAHDGHIDLNKFTTEKITEFILERVRLNENGKV